MGLWSKGEILGPLWVGAFFLVLVVVVSTVLVVVVVLC